MSVPAPSAGTFGRPIKGPSALGDDGRRFLQLTWALAVTDFKLRFFGSVLGYLWQIMRPLMLFGVLYFVFTKIFGLGDDKYYGVSLLLGLVLYGFFAEATTGSVRSLMERENLVRKIAFPRLAVPLACVLTALFNLCLNLLPVLFVLLVLTPGRPHWSWLELPVLVAGLAVFAIGFAMILSSLFVRYRDVEPIWDVFLQIMFYSSPIIFTVKMVTDKAGASVTSAMLLNPFSALLQQARHAFVDPSQIGVREAVGNDALLLVPAAIVVVLFAIGFWVFNREAPRIAENL
jgi:ABC-2 type transport system permease protein